MGTGKKKIEIKKITKESSRMVTFSKRRKGLFKKAVELESKTSGVQVAVLVFSPTGKPYTCGGNDVLTTFQNHCDSSHSSESATNAKSDHLMYSWVSMQPVA
ncbi:PREDICTED: MADS-box transcription factor 23-like [Nicotiana attenuata]|uniref:MADS-box transcription factor 23-like n=1 Tax=Nicotiana attenuata TaxID=49451 RepID=UPI0009051E31|nr:PREDICTED: MADS-box transcription factor 23-like [Nicotiana attenuata]